MRNLPQHDKWVSKAYIVRNVVCNAARFETLCKQYPRLIRVNYNENGLSPLYSIRSVLEAIETDTNIKTQQIGIL